MLFEISDPEKQARSFLISIDKMALAMEIALFTAEGTRESFLPI